MTLIKECNATQPVAETTLADQLHQSGESAEFSDKLSAPVRDHSRQRHPQNVEHVEINNTDYHANHLSLAINGAKLGLWDWDLITNTTIHNDWWGRLIVYSPEEVQAWPTLWEDCLHPEDRPIAFHQVEQLISGNVDFYDAEFRLRSKTGEWVWLLSRANVVRRNDEGLPTRVAGTHQDITDRKHIEQQLAQERQLLRSLIDAIPDHIFAKDVDGHYIVKNRAVADFIGSDPESLNAQSDFDFYPHTEAQCYREQELQIMHDGVACLNQLEARANPITAKTATLSTSKVPLYDTQSNVVGLVGISRDVTVEQSMAAELHRQEQRFRDFAELGADVFWETDAELNYTFVSDSFTDATNELANDRLGQARGSYALANGRDQQQVAMWQKHLNSLAKQQPFQDFEYSIKNKSTDKIHHIRSLGIPFFNDSGQFQGYRGIDIDVTESKQLSDQLQFQAEYDALTGLLNRPQFERHLSAALNSTRRENDHFILGYLDLDQFKLVNDTAGHAAGDELLQKIARLLSNELREQDLLARLGGDEFGLLLHDCSIAQAKVIAERMVAKLATFTFHSDPYSFTVGVSIGLVDIGLDNTTADELMSHADIACYAAKDLGRNRVHVYSNKDSQISRRHDELHHAASLRDAIEQNRLRLYQQPIAKVIDGNPHIITREVLLRIADLNGNLITPASFIPAAERYGLMPIIDRWVIRNALEAIQRTSCELAINLSGHSLNDPEIAAYIESQINHYQIAPQQLCFEITETALISNIQQATLLVQSLRALGCGIALDDFGSGLSSFGYLKQFTVDYLKIDGSFIRNITTSPTDKTMVEAIHHLSRSLGIETVAEFVENEATIDCLVQIGIDYIQGYVLGEPAPLIPKTG